MTSREAIETISRTPWLLAIPIIAASAVIVIFALNGELTGEAVAQLFLSFGAGAVTGGAVRRQKQITPPKEEAAEEKT